MAGNKSFTDMVTVNKGAGLSKGSIQLYKSEGEIWELSLHQPDVNLVFWLSIGFFGTKS